MTERVGQFLGNYQLLRLLGRGAFAEVYLAEHRYLEVPAAIKVLHMRMEPDTHAQFLREARTIAHLQHPHIVRVLEFGFQDQTPFLVMEYTPNGTLRTQHPKGMRLSLEQVVSYVKQIAPALDYAHQQRVIHRDVKPENMLLNTNDEVVLSDFGIAVVQHSLGSLSTQNPAGTPLYMAPEQIQGKPTAASDQYALGVLVYEWLCGEPPFRGSLFEVFSQHLHLAPPSLCDRIPSLPPAVEDAVFGVLAKEPQARFVTVQDFAGVLENVSVATQSLSLSLSSVPLAQEQISSPDTFPAPIHGLLPKEQEQSFSTMQPLAPYYIHTADNKEPAALEGLPPTIQAISSSGNVRVPVSRTNRQRLLKKVRAFWIAGVLEHSLHGAALVALGLEEQPEAVANPWQLALHQPAGAPYPLSVGTRITEVYDAAAGELLILGAPGSGKTTLLLEIARDLLDRAEHDEHHPLPVVFNLSSWATKQQPLVDWLVEELSSTYQVPRKLGRAWVDTDQILSLLDGLDEVAPRERTACIEAINTYRQEHGLLPLVVCSRSADYLAQTARVRLGSAVMVQPLTEQQVDDYLARGGEPLWALRVALHQDAGLRELTNTPLMLSILTLTYHGLPIEELLRGASLTERQRQLFERYIERMLRYRESEMRYTPEQTTHWLSWLARQMKRQNQTVFYIEHLQPDWLKGDRTRRAYDRWALWFPAIFIGMLVCLGAHSLLLPWILPSFTSLALNLALGGFMGWLLYAGSSIQQPQESGEQVGRGIWSRLVERLKAGILIGLAAGLGAGLLIGLNAGFVAGLGAGLLIGLGSILLKAVLDGIKKGIIVGSLLGLSLGLLIGVSPVLSSMVSGAVIPVQGSMVLVWGSSLLLSQLLIVKPIGIVLTDELIWSWRSLGRSLLAKSHILTTLSQMAFVGLIGGLNAWQSNSLSFGLSYGLSFWLVIGLLQGVSSETMSDQHRVVPNQGVRRSARNCLVLGLISAGIVGLSVGLSVGLAFGLGFRLSVGLSVGLSTALSVGLSDGLIVGLSAGLLVGLFYGGLACLQHGVVRLLLWRAGSIPWNYPRFLDSAAERILLRKMGGGYIFVHRLLLEYFVSLESASTPAGDKAQKLRGLPVW